MEYRLTIKGQQQGVVQLEKLPKEIRDYIIQVSRFVRELIFSKLVQAVYKTYPNMKINSTFCE